MFRLETELERMVGVLHDVVEDTPYTLADLRELGYSEDLLLALDGVTRREGEPYEDFVLRSKANPISRRVKLADLEDNMDVRRMIGVTPKDMERLARYRRAWAELQQSESINI